MSLRLETGSMPFEDTAVAFTSQEQQVLDAAQRSLHEDVMLDGENCGILVLLDHCIAQTELVSRWECGFEPWSVAEA